jgi:GNAT superfamily N-acetyltransferase
MHASSSGIDSDAFCAIQGPDPLTPEVLAVRQADANVLLPGEARCSLWWRQVPMHADERVGLIGHYAAATAATSARLLEVACERLREAGCTLAIGPMDGNTWRRYRLLTQRGSEPRFFLEPDNPDDWPGHWEQAGFAPLAQYYSAVTDDVGTPVAPAPPAGFSVRTVDPARYPQELDLLWRLASDAFSANFLYTPEHREEFVTSYARLLPVLRPEVVHIAEYEGVPVGFCFGVEDTLRGERHDTMIVKSIAVSRAYLRRGLGRVLYGHAISAGAALGLRRVIVALMHEANPSRRIAGPAARDFRRYTLYARSL